MQKYEPWEIDADAGWLCSTDDDCKIYLDNAPDKVFKCGAPLNYNLTLESD